MNNINNMTKQNISLLVDRSGSMRGKVHDTVGGINSCLDEIKKTIENPNDEIKISLTLFDHEQVEFWKNKKITECPEFLISDFIPRGQTAILDTLGDCLTNIILNQSNDISYIIYISTDGLENASKRYDKDQIKFLIQKAENDFNIKVMYLGANQDAILEASNLGINKEQAINYSEGKDTVEAVFRAVGASAYRQRSGIEPSFSQAERQSSQPGLEPTRNNSHNIGEIPQVLPITRERGYSNLQPVRVTRQ